MNYVIAINLICRFTDGGRGYQCHCSTNRIQKKFGGKRFLAYQLRVLMSSHFSTSFFGDWWLQQFLSVVSVS